MLVAEHALYLVPKPFGASWEEMNADQRKTIASMMGYDSKVVGVRINGNAPKGVVSVNSSEELRKLLRRRFW